MNNSQEIEASFFTAKLDNTQKSNSQIRPLSESGFQTASHNLSGIQISELKPNFSRYEKSIQIEEISAIDSGNNNNSYCSSFENKYVRKLNILKNNMCLNISVNILLLVFAYTFIIFDVEWFQIEHQNKIISFKIMQINDHFPHGSYQNLNQYINNNCYVDILEMSNNVEKKKDLCRDQVMHFQTCFQFYILLKVSALLFNLHSIVKCLVVLFIKTSQKKKKSKNLTKYNTFQDDQFIRVRPQIQKQKSKKKEQTQKSERYFVQIYLHFAKYFDFFQKNQYSKTYIESFFLSVSLNFCANIQFFIILIFCNELIFNFSFKQSTGFQDSLYTIRVKSGIFFDLLLQIMLIILHCQLCVYMRSIFRYKKAMFLDDDQWEIEDDLFGLDQNLQQNEFNQFDLNEVHKSEQSLLDELIETPRQSDRRYFTSMSLFGFKSQMNQELFRAQSLGGMERFMNTSERQYDEETNK